MITEHENIMDHIFELPFDELSPELQIKQLQTRIKHLEGNMYLLVDFINTLLKGLHLENDIQILIDKLNEKGVIDLSYWTDNHEFHEFEPPVNLDEDCAENLIVIHHGTKAYRCKKPDDLK